MMRVGHALTTAFAGCAVAAGVALGGVGDAAAGDRGVGTGAAGTIGAPEPGDGGGLLDLRLHLFDRSDRYLVDGAVGAFVGCPRFHASTGDALPPRDGRCIAGVGLGVAALPVTSSPVEDRPSRPPATVRTPVRTEPAVRADPPRSRPDPPAPPPPARTARPADAPPRPPPPPPAPAPAPARTSNEPRPVAAALRPPSAPPQRLSLHTAVVIASLGVFVMIVSVGALSSALRVR